MKRPLAVFPAVLLTLAALLAVPGGCLFAQTNFVKYVGNPILPLGNPGEWDDVEAAYAHVSFDGTNYQMWYSGAPQENTYRIGYATSLDGVNWTKDAANPVLGVGAPGTFDNTDVWLPAVLFDGTRYEMWYTGNISSGGIGYATATDPTLWTRHSGTPVLTRGGTWDQNRILNPIVIRSDTLYQMWYSAESASGRWQTGYASSTDGVTWSKSQNNPRLTVGAVAEWDAVAALAGSVIFADGQFHMWYHGTTGNAFSGWEIGYAISPDGVNWTKHPGNPIVQPGSGSWDDDIVGFPRVMKDGNRYRMWYTGRRSGSIDRLGYAEDFSNAAHTDSIRVSANTVVASDTILFDAYIANPHSENLTAQALIKSNDGSVNELVDLTEAGNGLWRGEWTVPANAHEYSVGVELNNLSAGYVHNSFDWGISDEFSSFVTSVNNDTQDNIPAEFALQQNYPNPFNPTTTIEFSLPQSGFVTLKVYNLLGEGVATLLQAHKPAGKHTVNFDASELTSGIYYYTLTAGDFKQTRKMLLMR